MPSSTNIIELRQLLTERFPGVRLVAEPASARATEARPSGIPQLDDLLPGGLPKGAIVELVCAAKNSGSALVSLAVLQRAHDTNQWTALIDGHDSFDPTPVGRALLSRLLWLRCQTADEAQKCADLLLRDGNIDSVILDLAANPAADLRKISASAWYRFQRLVEQNGVALLVLTPRAMVSSAHSRLALKKNFVLEDVELNQEALLEKIKIEVIHSEFAAARRTA